MTKRTSHANAGAVPLCAACVRQSTSGGHEPLDPDMRWAEAGEACGAPDCVARDESVEPPPPPTGKDCEHGYIGACPTCDGVGAESNEDSAR